MNDLAIPSQRSKEILEGIEYKRLSTQINNPAMENPAPSPVAMAVYTSSLTNEE